MWALRVQGLDSSHGAIYFLTLSGGLRMLYMASWDAALAESYAARACRSHGAVHHIRQYGGTGMWVTGEADHSGRNKAKEYDTFSLSTPCPFCKPPPARPPSLSPPSYRGECLLGALQPLLSCLPHAAALVQHLALGNAEVKVVLSSGAERGIGENMCPAIRSRLSHQFYTYPR